MGFAGIHGFRKCFGLRKEGSTLLARDWQCAENLRVAVFDGIARQQIRLYYELEVLMCVTVILTSPAQVCCRHISSSKTLNQAGRSLLLTCLT